MKTFKYLTSALLAAGLGACSSDDVALQNAGQPQWDAEGKGYISLNINLPQEKGNRANDQFEDGEASEYAVHNAKLLLYKGASEAAAQYVATYSLNVTGFEPDGNNQITASGRVVQEISKVPLGEKENLYALVVLNDNGKVAADADLAKTAQTFAGGVGELTKYGIFMANAPLYTAAGGEVTDAPSGTLQTLVPVNPLAIKTTPEEAALTPAATVFVERAVGKVEVKMGEFKLAAGHNALMKEGAFKVKGWILDQTNTKSFLVRDMTDSGNWWQLKHAESDNYRFVGGTEVKTDVKLFRTYWANDPNYTATLPEDLSTQAMQQLADNDFKAGGTYAYCLENTVDLTNMQEKNLTRVVVGVAFDINPETPDVYEDFYLLNKNTSKYYDEEGVIKEVKRQILNTILPDLATYLKQGKLGEENLYFELSQKGMHEGYKEVDGINLKITAGQDWEYVDGGEALLKAKVLEVIANVNTNMTIAYYKGGLNYYPVYVKHFGDDLTPWNQPATGGAYDTDANYLGRYGVLRNNWYEVNVTSVKNFGEPEVPEGVIDTPDPTDSFMAVDINILSWAKRSQNADL